MPEASLRIAPRLWLPAVVAIGLSFAAGFGALAANGPDNDTPPSPPAATAGAAYTSAIKLTGPTTPFHDSVASRYNYAFGKESPFLPSNAMSVNGQFLSPKSFYRAQYC